MLADPVTGESLRLDGELLNGMVDKGHLISPSGARYPIVDGIPRFVRDGYADSFGLQWNRFASVQLDSTNGGDYSKLRFDRETGWRDEDVRGKWVVDAGCGSGRFAEVVAALGAEVIAVDMSIAVDAAAANLGHLPNVHFIQADVAALPLKPATIDGLYSLGVLQHTPEPVATARALVEFLRPAAVFAFTIYGRRRWTKLYSKYVLRHLTRRVDSMLLLRAVEGVMPVMFPVTSILFALPWVGRLFRFVIPIANYPEQRDLPRNVRYKQTVLDTFDMLSPRYDNPVTPDEIRRGLGDVAAGLTFVSAAPVIVSGTRAEPVSAAQ